MSKNRDNIFWQRPDGKWVGGFYTFHEMSHGGYGDEDSFDDEWDVEYDTSSFWCATNAHSTYEAAMDEYCQHESNPGGGMVMEYRAGECDEERAEYERMYEAAVAAGNRLSNAPRSLYGW